MSTSPPMMSSDREQKDWARQVGRSRVFMFFWAFAVVAIGNVIGEENDMLLHVIDDYVDIVLAVIAIVVLVRVWKKGTAALKRANDVSAVLAVMLIAMTIFAITQEIGDPADFGNEIPTLLFGIFMLINRFV
jgi:hypothetical protein